MDDLISREAAIAAISGPTIAIDSENWIKVSEVRESIKALSAARLERGEWIPCKERQPKTNDPVNVTWVNHNPEAYYSNIKDKPFVAMAHYHKGHWYWYSSVTQDYLDEYGEWTPDLVDKDVEIIAWMPLPEPYEGNKDHEGGRDGMSDLHLRSQIERLTIVETLLRRIWEEVQLGCVQDGALHLAVNCQTDINKIVWKLNKERIRRGYYDNRP